jgi:hypothetical protein
MLSCQLQDWPPIMNFVYACVIETAGDIMDSVGRCQNFAPKRHNVRYGHVFFLSHLVYYHFLVSL